MGTSAELAPIAFRHEQRQSPRRRVSLPFALQLASGKQAWLSDIGEGGLGVSGSTGLEMGTSARLQFRLPETSSTLDVLGTVVWSDGSGRAGLRFTQVESDSAVALLHWLSSGMGTSTQTGDAPQDAALEIKIHCLREITELKAAISAQALDRDAALDLIVRRIADLTRASGAAIALQEGEDVVCRARVGNAPDLGVKLSSSSLSGECLRTGNVVLLEDSENDPRVNPEICRDLNLRSLLILPVVSGSRNVGIAEALSPNPRNFQSSDILTVSFLNDLIAGVATDTEEVAESAAGITLGDFEQMVAAAQDAEEAEQKLRAQESTSTMASPMPMPSVETAAAAAAPAIEIESPQIQELPKYQQRSFREKPRAEEMVAPAAIAETRSATMGAIESGRATATKVPDQGHRSVQLPVIAAAIVALILATFGITYSLRRSTVTPKPVVQTAPTSSAANPGQPSAPQAPTSAAAAVPIALESNAPKPVSHVTKSKPEAQVHEPDREVQLNPAHNALSQATNDAAPEAPAIGQIAGPPSSGIAASIIAAKTAAPELTPIQSLGVVEGKLTRKVLPQYPDMARRAGVSGDVVLSGTISTDGKLKNLKVVSGSPLLREAAMAAARQWRYSPYLLGGKPVETETHITISFHR